MTPPMPNLPERNEKIAKGCVIWDAINPIEGIEIVKNITKALDTKDSSWRQKLGEVRQALVASNAFIKILGRNNPSVTIDQRLELNEQILQTITNLGVK